MPKRKTFYLSYDGMTDPLGQSQVIPYLKYLSKEYEIHLFSFEKPNNIGLVSKIRSTLKSNNIIWTPITYTKSPPVISKIYDILKFFLIVNKNFKIHHPKLLHCRGHYITSLIGLRFRKQKKVKYVFDMRGFWADERVDGNIWKKESRVYKITKLLEKSFIVNADHIISLTHKAIEEIYKFPYVFPGSLDISVISTCVDLKKFSSKTASTDSHFTLGYLGTVGTWYLFHETIQAFKIFLDIHPNSKILIVNKGEHKYIQESLENSKVALSSVEIIAANHQDIPILIKRMDAAVFFLKPLFSKHASAPTKLGEFLASGVPCLTNEGIGDMSDILNSNKVGKTIDVFSKSSIREGIIELIELTQQKDIMERCRKAAESYFSLSDGINSYSKIYKSLYL